MSTKTVLELAAGFAADTYTEDALMEMCGDDDIVSDIISIAGGLIDAGFVVGATKAVLDTETKTDIIDTVGDVVSGLNPFSL